MTTVGAIICIILIAVGAWAIWSFEEFKKLFDDELLDEYKSRDKDR